MAKPERRAEKEEMTLGISASYPEISLSLIDRDPNQPRKDFDEANIKGLAKSIQSNSLLQAVTIRHNPTSPGRYIIVAGERRFRAMETARIDKAVFKLIEGPGIRRSYVLSAIENIHRQNLNPIEEAICYQRLHDEEHMTWEGVGELLDKDPAVILTKIKLLTLPPEIQMRVRSGNLPQVTALNLTQWRNEEGEYLRMAHDLIAGRDPSEIHFRKDTALGQRLVQSKLPRTPEDFATRIVKLSGHVQSMPAVLEAFLRLTPAEQAKAFKSINPSVLGRLRVRFVALYRAIQAVSEQMNNFDSVRIEKERPPDDTGTLAFPAKEPVGTQSLELSYKVVSSLFYSNGRAHVNLSKSRLQNAVPSSEDPDVLVKNAITLGHEYWRMAPRGSEAMQKFIRLMHRFRHDFGDPLKFDDALKLATKMDHSQDPVNL